MQHRVEPAPTQNRCGFGDVALYQLRVGRHRIRVSGGAVVEDDHFIAFSEQLPGDDGTDVAGAADHQRLHRATVVTSRNRAAAVSGLMSFTNAPIADSEPARYFSLPTARRMVKTSRCSRKSSSSA